MALYSITTVSYGTAPSIKQSLSLLQIYNHCKYHINPYTILKEEKYEVISTSTSEKQSDSMHSIDHDVEVSTKEPNEEEKKKNRKMRKIATKKTNKALILAKKL